MKPKTLSIRIEEKMLRKFRVVAKHNNRSMNSEISILIRNAVKRHEEKHGELMMYI